MPETTNHGVALHYETTGEGEPLLLIPGLGSDASNWPQVDKRLAERFQLVLMDNRGAGRSDSPPPPYAMADMAGDCLCVLDHLGLESAHVLGHSMGGAIALELAINHPGRLRRLVLGSTTARLSARNEQLFDAWVELIRQGCDAEAVTREIFLWMYPPWMYEDPVFLDTLVRECMEYPYFQPFDGLVGQVEALRGFDVRDRLGDIQAPVLVLHGEQDQLIPPDEGVSLGRAIPGSRVEILDGAGHLPHRQLRESFARLAGDFLEE